MFADDIDLVRYAREKYGPLPQPIVDVGGLERPCVADYARTIGAMRTAETPEQIAQAQRDRYLDLPWPLRGALGCDYSIENPEAGGLPIERLDTKYKRSKGTAIGTAIVLSTLEHVANPFIAVDCLGAAMKSGGIVIVSVPWQFPHHPSPRDLWRFSPDALREVFAGIDYGWDIFEADWRLRIPATAGVLNARTGEPQIIESCYLIARAR